MARLKGSTRSLKRKNWILNCGCLRIAKAGIWDLRKAEKINSSSLSTPNGIIIGENFYRILKSFTNIIKSYNFINNGEYKITETIGYSTFNVKKLINH